MNPRTYSRGPSNNEYLFGQEKRVVCYNCTGAVRFIVLAIQYFEATLPYCPLCDTDCVVFKERFYAR